MTDLHTIENLDRQCSLSSQRLSSCSQSLAETLWLLVESLAVTLSLPLSFYEAQESSSTPGLGLEAPTMLEVSTFNRLASSINDLSHLRRLELWLDHRDAGRYWSLVNERAALGQFEKMHVERPDIELSITLPKLIPWKSDLKRHYISNNRPCPEDDYAVLSPLKVRRVLRLRFRPSKIPSTGETLVLPVKDFPFCYDPRLVGHRGMTLVQQEQYEITMWKDRGQRIEESWDDGLQVYT